MDTKPHPAAVSSHVEGVEARAERATRIIIDGQESEMTADLAARWFNTFEQPVPEAARTVEALCQVIRDLLQSVRALSAQGTTLLAMLAECYRATGVDPDGNSDAMLAPYAIEEVRRLRTGEATVDAALVEAEAALAQALQVQSAATKLVEKWRAEAARINSFHATMGTGYTVCADALDQCLALCRDEGAR